MYEYILKGIPNLGFGLETNGEMTIHIPMAYGTIAMAAAIHRDTSTARAAADWLCANSTSTLKTGWGLNWAWDAFSKGAINPADTLYGVTIAIAVDGLYRTYQLTGDKRYLDTAVDALIAYAEQHSIQSENAIYFHYSDQPADHGYRVANITAMLLAQYATIGAATHNLQFIALADKAYEGLMFDALDGETILSWHYLSNSKKPRGNDLIHAAFISYGLYLYAQTKANNLEIERVLNKAALYLEGFVLEEIVYEFHQTERPLSKNQRARSWAVGMLLFVAKQMGNKSLTEQALSVISDYEFAPGRYSYRLGDQLHSPRAVAFLLLGVA